MPKTVEAPAKKKAKVEEKPAAKKNGKAEVKAEAPAKKKKKTATSALSARDCVLKVLVAGAPRSEIKERAKAIAKEAGADVSFKTFDVGFFIKHLETKGYTVVTKKSGLVKVTAPAKGEAPKTETKAPKTKAVEAKVEVPAKKKKAKK